MEGASSIANLVIDVLPYMLVRLRLTMETSDLAFCPADLAERHGRLRQRAVPVGSRGRRRRGRWGLDGEAAVRTDILIQRNDGQEQQASAHKS
jgi:hypothetical protein